MSSRICLPAMETERFVMLSIGMLFRSICRNEVGDSDGGKRFFDLVFQRTPHLIGLAVGDLEAGELAFDGGGERLDRAIELPAPIPHTDSARVACQCIAP